MRLQSWTPSEDEGGNQQAGLLTLTGTVGVTGKSQAGPQHTLVKNRMEQSGMRWSINGAQAVLNQRAVLKNGDWNDFFTYYIDSERERRYPTLYDRGTPSYQKAA